VYDVKQRIVAAKGRQSERDEAKFFRFPCNCWKFPGFVRAKMKKLILSLAIAACTVLSVQAQTATPTPGGKPEGHRGAGHFSPEERLKHLTEKLSLTADQQTQIKQIFEDGRAAFQGLKDLPKDQRREQARELMKTQHEKIMAVLTPDQQAKFKAMIAEHKGEWHGRHGGACNKGGGQPK
jgi:Spy/CpxP family protein refolding chaperone